MLYPSKLPSLKAKHTPIPRKRAGIVLVVGAILGSYGVNGRNFSPDCVFPSGSLEDRFIEVMYPESMCGAIRTTPSYEVGSLVLNEPGELVEQESFHRLSRSIEQDIDEVRQRSIIIDLLMNRNSNQWHNISELKDEQPYKVDGSKQYFKTKIANYAVLYDTKTKRLELIETAKDGDGSNYVVIIGAEFPKSLKK